MNLTRLQTFVEVVRAGTFAGAADALMFTPSAVSQQMAKLEAEIGAPLFVRGGGCVALSDAGRLLHERAQAIVVAVREAQADIDALSAERLRRLRLGSFPAATAGIVPRALRLFRRRLPSTEVELLDLDARAGLWDARLDIGLEAGLAGAFEEDPATDVAVLASAPLSVALPTGHPLAAREALDLGALDGTTIVGSSSMPELAELMRRCTAAGVRPALTGWRVPDPHALVQLAAAGEGLAVVPALLADGVPPRTALRPLIDGPEWQLRALRPARGVVPVTTLAMIEALRAVVTIDAARPSAAPLVAA